MGNPSFDLPGEALRRLLAAETSMISKSIRTPVRIRVGVDEVVFERTDADTMYRLVMPAMHSVDGDPAVVSSTELASVVKLLDEDITVRVTVDHEEKRLGLNQAHRWWYLEFVPDDMPLLPDPPAEWGETLAFTRQGSRQLTHAIRRVVPFTASMQDQLPILGCVNVRHSQDRETIRLATTDRYVAAMTSLWTRTGSDVADFEANVPGAWLLRVAQAMDKDPWWALSQIKAPTGGQPMWVALRPVSTGIRGDQAGTLFMGAHTIDGDFPKVAEMSLFQPHENISIGVPDAHAFAGQLRLIPSGVTVKLVITPTGGVFAEWADGSTGGIDLGRVTKVDRLPKNAHVVGAARDYLLQAVKAFDDNSITLSFHDNPSKPIHLGSVDAGLQVVVMPKKLSGGN